VSQLPLLSLAIWLPALGALALAFVPRAQLQTQRYVALGFALAALACALGMLAGFDYEPGIQFGQTIPWVPAWGVGYVVAVDGISLWLVVLSAFLTPLALLASWGETAGNQRTFQALLLLLATGLTGVFAARDLLLFYIFFEFTLVPTALLIGAFGGANRVAAATKFFLYPFSASLLMLVGIIALYLLHGQRTGLYTFDYQTLLASLQVGTLALSELEQRLLFGAFFVAFAVKVPLWPFHTWMPEAAAAAPNSGAVDVAGMMVKIGAYGMIRYCVQLFPAAAVWAAPAVAVLATVGVLYAAWVASSQTDMKRLLAYASVSHLGFIVLGIFAFNAQGLSGAVVQMISSAITTGALFFVVGMLFARNASREVRDFGGVWKAAPRLGSLTLVAVLATIGLPGLSSFVGEFAIMQGAWISAQVGYAYVLAAVFGTVLAAVYLLRMFQRAFLGDVTPATAAMPDLRPRELAILVALIVPMVAFGLYPNALLAPMQPAVNEIAGQIGAVLALR
jgi:NADH-quinone oxidoreductase subunit M